jgi:phospholipid/cholesterol/gamma-HCH transport system ATP-binding protein
MIKQPVIQVKNLVARYGLTTILDNINFTVYTGEIFMIVGVSGCGKTTLLNHIIGLQEPAEGEIFIDGENLFKATEKEQIEILKKIGVLYQHDALFGSMTLLENVALPLQELTSLPTDAIKTIACNKLEMVELGDFGDYLPAEISGGMQKRVALARAMALDPKILFLDEPSAGLDPIISAGFDKLIVDLSKILGITFVIISHNLLSINRIAQKIILLQKGHIALEGDLETVNSSKDHFVEEFFHPEVNA